MSYIENPITEGDNFASIRGNINENDAYFKESIDDLHASIDNSVIFGVYVGNGNEIRDINIGSRPIAVEIYRSDGAQLYLGSSGGVYHRGGLAIDGFPCIGDIFDEGSKKIEVIDKGFRVYYNKYGSSNISTGMNIKDYTYYYKAYMRGQINS